MTKKDLVKIIREVVRREVKKEVGKIFIKEETSSKLEDIIPEISEKKEPKKFTDNEALNKVLNETVGLSSKENMEEYPTVSGKGFDTSRMAELMGYGKSEEVKRDMVAVDTMKKAGVTSEQVPKGVLNALTRDYSDLMKHDKMKRK
tara:strand:- start:9694 stop:10131 length:438 start_codon:yes stop_codon:yes gene_type:complete